MNIAELRSAIARMQRDCPHALPVRPLPMRSMRKRDWQAYYDSVFQASKRSRPSASTYLSNVPSDILACILAFLAPCSLVHTYAELRARLATLSHIGTVCKRLHAAFPVSVLKEALRRFEPPFEPIFLQDLRAPTSSKAEFLGRLRTLDAAYLGWRKEWPYVTIFSGKVRSIMKIPGVMDHYLPFQYQSLGRHKQGHSTCTSAAAWLALCIHGPKQGFADGADAERHRCNRPTEVVTLEKHEQQRRMDILEAKQAAERQRARNRAHVSEWLQREYRAAGPSVTLAQRTYLYKSLVRSGADVRNSLTPALRVAICREIVERELSDLRELLRLRDACAERAARENLAVPASLLTVHELFSEARALAYPVTPAGLRAFRGSRVYANTAAAIERENGTIELAIRVAQLDKRWDALCAQFQRKQQRLYECCGVPVCTPESGSQYPSHARLQWGPADRELLAAREHAFDAFRSDARRLDDLHTLVMASGLVVKRFIFGSAREAVASLVALHNVGKSLDEIFASDAFAALEQRSTRRPLAIPAPGSREMWIVRIQEGIADHGLDGETIKNQLREADGRLPCDFPHPFYKFCSDSGLYVRKM